MTGTVASPHLLACASLLAAREISLALAVMGVLLKLLLSSMAGKTYGVVFQLSESQSYG